MDIITCDKFFSDRLRDVDSVGVKNAGFPLTKPMAVNTGLRNCADCDCPIGLCTVNYFICCRCSMLTIHCQSFSPLGKLVLPFTVFTMAYIPVVSSYI